MSELGEDHVWSEKRGVANTQFVENVSGLVRVSLSDEPPNRNGANENVAHASASAALPKVSDDLLSFDGTVLPQQSLPFGMDLVEESGGKRGLRHATGAHGVGKELDEVLDLGLLFGGQGLDLVDKGLGPHVQSLSRIHLTPTASRGERPAGGGAPGTSEGGGERGERQSRPRCSGQGLTCGWFSGHVHVHGGRGPRQRESDPARNTQSLKEGTAHLDILAGRESVRGTTGGNQAVTVQSGDATLAVGSGTLPEDTPSTFLRKPWRPSFPDAEGMVSVTAPAGSFPAGPEILIINSGNGVVVTFTVDNDGAVGVLTPATFPRVVDLQRWPSWESRGARCKPRAR